MKDLTPQEALTLIEKVYPRKGVELGGVWRSGGSAELFVDIQGMRMASSDTIRGCLVKLKIIEGKK